MKKLLLTTIIFLISLSLSIPAFANQTTLTNNDEIVLEKFNSLPSEVYNQLNELEQKHQGKVIKKEIIINKTRDLETYKKSFTAPQTIYEDEVSILGSGYVDDVRRKTRIYGGITITVEYGIRIDNKDFGADWEDFLNLQATLFNWVSSQSYGSYGGYVEKCTKDAFSEGKEYETGNFISAINDPGKYKSFSPSVTSDSFNTYYSNPYYIYYNENMGGGATYGRFVYNMVWYVPRNPYVESYDDRIQYGIR